MRILGSPGVLGHPKGQQNKVERFGVTPRRNMGWDWGHPKKYGVERFGVAPKRMG